MRLRWRTRTCTCVDDLECPVHMLKTCVSMRMLNPNRRWLGQQALCSPIIKSTLMTDQLFVTGEMEATLKTPTFERMTNERRHTPDSMNQVKKVARPGGERSNHHVSSTILQGVAIVSLHIDGKDRLCLAQISNTLLKDYSYNEIHNRRVALGITCVQCTPVQLEILRRAGAMPISSRRCGMITCHEAERLVRSFLAEAKPPKLPENFAFGVRHNCGWGCRGSFIPSRYNSSRAKCIKCMSCSVYFSPNKFIFHFHRTGDGTYYHPDAANFNSWRRHLKLTDDDPHDEIASLWEEVKAMFNGGSRKRIAAPYRPSEQVPGTAPQFKKRIKADDSGPPHVHVSERDRTMLPSSYPYPVYPTPSKMMSMKGMPSHPAFTAPFGGYGKPPLPVTPSAGGFALPPVPPTGWPRSLHDSFYVPYELNWAKHIGLPTAADLPFSHPPMPRPTAHDSALPPAHSPCSSVSSASVDSDNTGRNVTEDDAREPNLPVGYVSAFTAVSCRPLTELPVDIPEGLRRASPNTHGDCRASPDLTDVSRESSPNRGDHPMNCSIESEDDNEENNIDVDTIDVGETTVQVCDHDDDNNNSLRETSSKDATVPSSSMESADADGPVRLSVIEKTHAAADTEAPEENTIQSEEVQDGENVQQGQSDVQEQQERQEREELQHQHHLHHQHQPQQEELLKQDIIPQTSPLVLVPDTDETKVRTVFNFRSFNSFYFG